MGKCQYFLGILKVKGNKKSNIEYKMYEEEDDEMKHWK